MPVVDVKIVRNGDRAPWPDIADAAAPTAVVHDGRWQVALLEGGMASGKPSVALRLDLEDGRTVISQTSLEGLIATLAAARGAFPDVFAGGPFAAP